MTFSWKHPLFIVTIVNFALKRSMYSVRTPGPQFKKATILYSIKAIGIIMQKTVRKMGHEIVCYHHKKCIFNLLSDRLEYCFLL